MTDIQLVVKMHRNNISVKRIASILGISNLEVYQMLDKAGVKDLSLDKSLRDKQICRMYQKGAMIKEISKKMHVDRHAVTDILKMYMIYKGNKHASNLSEEKKSRNKKIISLYQQGLSYSQVSKKMHVCPGTVAKVLKTFGIQPRQQHQKGHSAGTSKNRKYNFNIDFFEKIDTEEKAYWLGFLYADGYVAYRGIINLSLQERDYSHLEKFLKSIDGLDIPIRYIKKTKSYRIDICSVKMARDLINLGCVQKKSLILKFPQIKYIPYNLIHHFMRGYFDGDGCISISKDKIKSFSLLGTKDFLDNYENILESLGIKRNKRIMNEYWNPLTQEIAYSSKSAVQKIYDFLYKDATIYLGRKECKFHCESQASQEEAI